MDRVLLVFDVDGVLVDARSSWGVVHEALGTGDAASVYARLYWDGRLSYWDWMYADTSLWLEAEPRLDREVLEDILWSRVGIVPGSHEAVERARRRGWVVALVSAGVHLVAERVAKELGVKLWFAPRLLFDERGRLIPGGEPVVEPDAKHLVVERVVRLVGASRVCVVGDTRLDAIPMRLYGCGVAVNPYDKVVVRASKGLVAKNPLEAIELIEALLSS